MAIFEIDKGTAKRVKLGDFKLEKDLQKLVENNLITIFNCRLIATEFSTGNIHSGRIDTLAISEDLNHTTGHFCKSHDFLGIRS